MTVAKETRKGSVMRFELVLPSFSFSDLGYAKAARLRDFATEAEARGYEALWAVERLLTAPGLYGTAAPRVSGRSVRGSPVPGRLLARACIPEIPQALGSARRYRDMSPRDAVSRSVRSNRRL
jgi:hypothetical protein